MRAFKKILTVACLMSLIAVQTTFANTTPEGYRWVNEGSGPGSAKLVDANGNIVDHASTGSINANHPSGPAHPGAGPGQAPGQSGESLETPQGAPNQGGQMTGNVDEPQENPGEARESRAAGTDPGQAASEQGTTGEAAQPETEAAAQEAQSGRVIDPNKPMIALTFDDGPYAPVGNRIMDVMNQYNSRCTFFVVGDRVNSYNTEMKRMAAEGFEIANHTYNHKYLTKLGAAAIREQISKCNSAIASVTGVSPVLMRLPGGLKNSTVLANVNMPMIMWNIDTMDWKHRNTQKTIDAVLGKVKDGDIVLMHELYTSTAAAVEYMVPKLIEQGFQLVTVSELASHRGGTANGHEYSSFRR